MSGRLRGEVEGLGWIGERGKEGSKELERCKEVITVVEGGMWGSNDTE